MEIQYDPDVQVSWGFFQCKCGGKYFPSNIPVHVNGCLIVGREHENGDVIYHYGSREVETVLSSQDGRSKCGRLTLGLLIQKVEQLPEALIACVQQL